MDHICEKLQLETSLNKALERDEFRLYYQPKLDLASGTIKGVEALIRWEHPEKGLVSPLEFIPLAEETGLIIHIGEWVLRTACLQNKIWQVAGLPRLVMAVNLSVRQLHQPNLIEMVQQVLEETGLDPECLELEITEYTVMDVHHVLPILREIKRIGVQISLDDFGTGYSSLYYLKEFPIDKIKIDKSFVGNCTMDLKDATIVKAIIAMAHELNIKVIAEGVESKEHLIFLQQNLCDKGQGYFFSKPMPPVEFVQKFQDIERIISRDGIPQDLSKQNWLKEALQKVRQELADTLRHQQGMIFKFIRRDGRFIYTLCDGELLYRIGLTPEQLIGKELHDVLTHYDAERKLQHYRRAWDGEENVVYEGKLNGTAYQACLRPVRKGGQVVEVIGSCVDITERIKKEQEASLLAERLAEREAKYRLIADTSDDLITVLDVNGIIRYISPSYERIFGFSMSGSKNQPGFQKVHPDDLPRIRKQFDNIIVNKNVVREEYRYLNSDGSNIWVEAIGNPILSPDGEIDRIFVVSRDISARKAQEEKLRESEQRYRRIAERLAEEEAKYRLIAENVQDLIRVWDTNGTVRYASPSHEIVLGYAPNVYEGNSSFDFVHPDDIPYVETQFAHMITSKTPCRVEFRYKHAQGDWVDMEAHGSPVLDEDGGVKDLIIVARDVTERKKVEEYIRKSEKLSVVGNMAAGVVHEIRNPLTSIKGFAQLLQKEAENPFYFDVMLSEIQRLESIIGEFLTLAKPHSPKVIETDVEVLLQQVIVLFSTQSILKNIEIVQDHDPDLPRIYCDENQIKQVFINILQNSVEAMPNGGILQVRMMWHDSHFIKFRFVDQGYGISDERMKHLGEPFFSSKEKGTGIGLMISHKIVQEHGGAILIDSIVNQGTTVDVILPVKHPAVLDH